MPRRLRPSYLAPISMIRGRIPALFCASILVLTFSAFPAFAQMGGGGMGGGGMGGGGMRPMGPSSGGGETKEEEGAAEAAPESQGQEPALQPLPAWPGQLEKALQFFQLNGYMRGRAYYFHDMNLGIPQGVSGPAAPFTIPYSEFGATGKAANPGNPASCAARSMKDCSSVDLDSADMRLRLEPTINVSDQVRVKAQIDIFDNYVMGSTPEGYFLNGQGAPRNAPLQAFSRTSTTPIVGENSLDGSINVKRAWMEARTPIGELRFGRMPSHWGTGMFVNSGDCMDCDYGVTADRVMFATKLFDHFIAIMYDWVASGPTTQLYATNQQGGVYFNADPIDDVHQVALAIGRQDKPKELEEKIRRGDIVVNYGGYFVYRWQGWDQITNPGGSAGVLGGTTLAKLSANLAERDAWAFIPDLWFRLNYKKLHIEAEGVIVGGQIGKVSDQVMLGTANNALQILQWGVVGTIDYRLLQDALHIGLQIGSASGDQAEDPNGVINYREAQLVHRNNRVNNFAFDPDFHVDLILFRRLIGTVTNATYFKPTASYDILENLKVSLDAIYSIANVAVSYPGNDNNLGLELDGSVLYHNDEEGFYVGVAYGVLFPFAGLSLPQDIFGTMFGHGVDVAQTVQGRVMVKF